MCSVARLSAIVQNREFHSTIRNQIFRSPTSLSRTRSRPTPSPSLRFWRWGCRWKAGYPSRRRERTSRRLWMPWSPWLTADWESKGNISVAGLNLRGGWEPAEIFDFCGFLHLFSYWERFTMKRCDGSACAAFDDIHCGDASVRWKSDL